MAAERRGLPSRATRTTGSALAFDDVLVIHPGEPQRRHIRAHIMDGRLDHVDARAWRQAAAPYTLEHV